MEYCSALKRQEILTLAPTWVSPEDITCGEIRQTEDKRCTGPRAWGAQDRRVQRECGRTGAGPGAAENDGLLFKGWSISVGG